MDSLEQAHQVVAPSRLDSFKESFLYYLCLWVTIGAFLIALDFSKDIPGLFDGRTILELAANLFVPALLVWLVAAALALAFSAMGILGWSKVLNFVWVFCFATINLWSLRVVLSVYLRNLTDESRGYIGLGLLAFILIGTLMIVQVMPEKLTGIDRLKSYGLGVWTLMTMVFACACGLIPFFAPEPITKASNRTPNIVMVTFDALSAANLQLYGYTRNTAPNIEELARESLVFDNFRANFSTTPPALSALSGVLGSAKSIGVERNRYNLFQVLAGSYPNQAFVSRFGSYAYFGQHLPYEYTPRSGQRTILYKLADRVLPSITLIYLSSLLSKEAHTYWPYNSEFADDIFLRKNLVPADLGFEAALEFLDKNPKGSFVWVHSWEPHYPYWPDQDVAYKFGPWSVTPADFINRFYPEELSFWVEELRNRYDASIYSVDRKFGEFIEGLKKRGFYDDSIIIVGSDHGESHSNGFVGHSGASVVEAITHIPLIIHLPGQKEQARVSVLAGQVDLEPTLLELLGLPAVNGLPGHSMVPYINDSSKKHSRLVFCVSYSAFLGVGGEIALYKDSYKVVYYSPGNTNIRLYDLSTDPDAVVDIIYKHKDIADKIMKEAGVY